MKKVKYLLLFILMMFPFTCKAAINCSTPGTVESGESFGVTYYGSIGGAAPIWFAKLGNEGNAYYLSGSLSVEGEETSEFSRTIYFTAGDPGTATFYAYDVDVASDSDSFSDSNSCSVEIVSATRPNDGSDYQASLENFLDDDEDDDVEESKSNDNYLKNLSINNVKLNPVFNKDTLKYTAVVNGDIEKITIKVEKSSDAANITGDGEKELKEGLNKIEIVVTAENGEKRVYEISITRKESNPIEVTIDKKKYTVVKKEVSLKVPEGYVKTKITINNEEVVAYTSSTTGYTLVALVDENGKTIFAKYDKKNETYEKYSEISSDKVRLLLINPDKKDIPYGYKKCTFMIDDQEVEGYALELESIYRLVYGINMSTGEKDFYLFDMEEKTFQRFYNTQVDIYRNLSKKLEIVVIGLASLLIIVFVIIVGKKACKKNKKITKKEDFLEEIKHEENTKDELEEETKTIEPVEDPEEETKEIENINELSKKERKRLEKEKKKQMAEERRNFLD